MSNEPKLAWAAEPKKTLTRQRKKWLITAAAVLIVVGLAIAAWQIFW